MRTVFFGLYFLITMIGTVIYLPKCYLLGKKDKYKQFEYAFSVMNSWAKKLFGVGAKSTIEVKGTDNIPKGQPILFVSNHQSNFDILAIVGYLGVPFGIISKQELKKIPIFSNWMVLFRCTFIDRSTARKSILAIEQSIKNIEEGYSQLIFPEGTRSRTRQMGEFKHGSLKIATKTNAVIVPISINNSYRIYEETGRIVPSHVKMIVHKPIYTVDLSEAEKKNMAGYVEEVIKKGLNELTEG